MKPMVLFSWLAAAWLVVVALLYWALVPQSLSMTGLVWGSIILLALVCVAVFVWGHSGPEQTIEDVLADVEHPEAKRKS